MFFATGFTLLLAVGLFVGLFLLNYKFRMKFYPYLSRLARTRSINVVKAVVIVLGVCTVYLQIIYLGLPWISDYMLSLNWWVRHFLIIVVLVFLFFPRSSVYNMVFKAVESSSWGGCLVHLVVILLLMLDTLFRLLGLLGLLGLTFYFVILILIGVSNLLGLV